MAKTKEMGLEHVIKLGITSVRDIRGIYSELARKYGQVKAIEIMEYLTDEDNPLSIYDRKNKDYDTAMIFSGGYDADIVRKACNWVYEHRECFGDEILEVGCDCGFMTTFLAKIFPDKHITAIDRNQSGIEIAKKNVEKFGLNNVSFICIDLLELKDKQFDTVFSMRTMQENGRSNEEEDCSNELITQANIFTNEKQEYANSLSSLIKEDGNLISIERLGHNAMLLAWIQVLTNAGLKIDLESYSELSCTEVGELNTFECLIFNKTDTADVNVYMSFMNCFAAYNDTSLPQYYDWDAKIMYEYTRGKLFEGYEVEDTKNNTKTRIVCCEHKKDNTCILCYQNKNGNVQLEYHDISELQDITATFRTAVKEVENIDYINVVSLKEENN